MNLSHCDTWYKVKAPLGRGWTWSGVNLQPNMWSMALWIVDVQMFNTVLRSEIYDPNISFYIFALISTQQERNKKDLFTQITIIKKQTAESLLRW